MAGALVTLEGCDGSGKSTTAGALCHRLEGAGYRVVHFNPKRTSADDHFVAGRLRAMAELLWERDAPEPRNLLSDRHWIYLSAAWFQIVDAHCLRPALSRADVVVADSWYHKLLARFMLKGEMLFEEARRCYASLSQPTLVCLLDVTPEEAAARKQRFGYSETGNFDGLSGVTCGNFLVYQGRVRKALSALARDEKWIKVDSTAVTTDEVSALLYDAVKAVLG